MWRSYFCVSQGWYAVLADPQRPVTSTLLDQAHNAILHTSLAETFFECLLLDYAL
jgi:hypothetical protein